VTPEALSAALTTTALFGRRLLSAPTITNSVANQSIFANAPFSLQVNISEVFSYSGSLPDVLVTQADETPLPDWLTFTMSTPPVLVGSLVIPGANVITVVDNHAYVAYGYRGLKIFNVSNKASPILVGSIATTKAQDISLIGNYAYLADTNGGLKIFDVTNKASPILVGSAVTINACGITVIGNYAYLADGVGGLKIFDVNNKTSPILIGRAATEGACGITVVGNYAYMTNYNLGLKIIDVSNKTNPILLGSAVTQYALGVAVVGNYAYVADGGGGLKIFDVSNKASPIFVGSVVTRGASGVTIVGNYAYLADYRDGFKIIDVSNKTSPIFVGSAVIGNPQDVAVVGNYAYLADGYSGLEIFSSEKTVLSGTPSPLNRGILPLKLTITDTFDQTASLYFSIIVLNNPPVAPTIEPKTVHHAFHWTLSEFSDTDGDALIYSATLTDGSSLPSWVSFDSATRALSGVVPPVVTVREIEILADDSHGGIT